MLTYHLTADEAARWRDAEPSGRTYRRELSLRLTAQARAEGAFEVAVVAPDGGVEDGWHVSGPYARRTFGRAFGEPGL